jgi:hypothetical protein
VRGIFNVTGVLHRGAATRLRCESHRRRIRGFPTNNRSPPAPARTAARWRSTVRPSSPPRAGIGYREFATATPVFGRASNSPTGACASSIRRSSRICRCRAPIAPISIAVPLENRRAATVRATLIARIRRDQSCARPSSLHPDDDSLARFPRISAAAPHRAEALVAERLWSGESLPTRARDRRGRYGRPIRRVRFGIRELTYELSLFDHEGDCGASKWIRPWAALGRALVDVRHEAIKRTPQGWAASLTMAGEVRAAVHAIASEALTPYLVDPRQRRAHRRARRKLGHGRFAQANFARAPGAVFQAASRCPPQHHPQLARAEYRGGLLRPGR